MNKTPHLLVCISGHGYGHVAQVAPVLNALDVLMPELRLTIRTSVPEVHLRRRVTPEFRYIAQSSDFGMRMLSALEVDVAASMRAYAIFHADWLAKVEAESAMIAELMPDLVLSDVAYLPLSGAANLKIPSVAMCSLNWADIFRHFCSKEPGAAEILLQMESAYAHSEAFLCLQPCMPMPWLTNLCSIAPVAELATNRRHEINRKLGLSAKHKLVLVSMGGIAMHMPVENWPVIPDVRWLLQSDWLTQPDGQTLSQRDDMLAFDLLDMGFSDLLASCDVLLTKPGYGAFTEAACNGIPVLYVKRGEWPEQEYLIRWLVQHGCCQKLNAAQVKNGDFAQELMHLLAQPKPAIIKPAGNLQAAEYLARLLARSQPARSISIASP